MSEIAIKAEGLSKVYRLGQRERENALRNVLGPILRAPWKLLKREKKETFWALKDVSLEVKQGEVLGLIGRNGAGKTTLLKILSRITRPTRGWAEIYGRVGTLLEVGTGFHPELSGRDNTYLSGAILGMTKQEISRKFDEIVAFAEIEKFIDMPVKHFSSGMYVRLAFAVAAHLEPEILLVDEVLAVGDISFQGKCLGKMGDVARQGRTVILVSHNMGAIARLCNRVVWVDGGEVRMDGRGDAVVNAYQSSGFALQSVWNRPPDLNGKGDLRFLTVGLKAADGSCASHFSGGSAIRLEIAYEVSRSLSGCQIGSRILNYEGTVIFTTSDADELGVSALPKEPGRYCARFQIPGGLLAPGSYTVLVAGHLPRRHVYDVVEQAVAFEISEQGSLTSLDGRKGVVTPLLKWETTKEVAPS